MASTSGAGGDSGANGLRSELRHVAPEAQNSSISTNPTRTAAGKTGRADFALVTVGIGFASMSGPAVEQFDHPPLDRFRLPGVRRRDAQFVLFVAAGTVEQHHVAVSVGASFL